MKENNDFFLTINNTEAYEEQHHQDKYNQYDWHDNKHDKISQVTYTKKDDKGDLYYIEYKFERDEGGFFKKISGVKTDVHSKEKTHILDNIDYQTTSVNTWNPEYELSFNQDGMLVNIKEESETDSTGKTTSSTELSYDDKGRLAYGASHVSNIDDEYTDLYSRADFSYDENGKSSIGLFKSYSNLLGVKKIITPASSDNEMTVNTKRYNKNNVVVENSIRTTSYRKDNNEINEEIKHEILDEDDQTVSSVFTQVKTDLNTRKLEVNVTSNNAAQRGELKRTIYYREPEPERAANSFVVEFDANGMPSVIHKYFYEGDIEMVYYTQIDADLKQGYSEKVQYHDYDEMVHIAGFDADLNPVDVHELDYNNAAKDMVADGHSTMSDNMIAQDDEFADTLNNKSNREQFSVSSDLGTCQVAEWMSCNDNEIAQVPPTLINDKFMQPYSPVGITSVLTQ